MPPLPRYFTLALLVAICLGALLRFVRLDYKPYWFNEVFTALRVSGYDEHDDANPRLYTGQVVTAADIQVFQRPSAGKSIVDTARIVLRKAPNQTPLYYVLARIAAQAVGDTVVGTRGLSALFSLLTLVGLAWLARALFTAPSVARVTVGLAAVSPLFIRYAQEARPYSLWLALILMASAVLLHALRAPSWLAWTAYAMLMALALYTHLLTLPVLAAHALYVVSLAGWRPQRSVVQFALAVGLALLAFSPWLWFLLRRWRLAFQVGEHLAEAMPLHQLAEAWALHLSRVFVAWPPACHALLSLALPLGLLSLYALYVLARHTPPRVWLLVLLFVVIPALPLVIPDSLFGGQRSTRDRYFFVTYLGLQLAVAYLLARQMTQPHKLRAHLWQVVSVSVIVVGLASSWASVQADTWWGLSEVDLDLARLFAAAPNTVVISDVSFGVIAPLSYHLPPDARFVLTRRPETLVIPGDADPLYLYQPSDRLRETVQDRLGRTLTLVYQKPREDGSIYSVYRIETP